jgi:glycosyltransferase involved in cell wall biosynthesis
MERLAYLCLSEGWGGLEMNQLRNAQQMQQRGHQVLLIANSQSPVAQAAKQANIPLYIVAQKPKHYQWLFARSLAKKLRQEAYLHLILRNNRELSIAASVRFFSFGKVRVHYFMEMALGGKKTQLFRTLRYACIDTWICPLPYLRLQVFQQTRISHRKVKEIPSGLVLHLNTTFTKEEARNQLRWPIDKKLFLLVGRIDPKKQQAFVWESFAQRTNTDEQLIFVGESTPDEPSVYYTALQREIKKHPKSNAVLWAGFQHNMALVYSAADLVVMASNFETVGMATLEALWNGCPVVGVNNGGTKAIIDAYNGGVCYDPLQSDSMNFAIDKVLEKDYPAFNKALFEQHFDFNRVCALVETEVLGLNAPIFQ